MNQNLINDNQPTVIRLSGGSGGTVTASTFEEAFGNHSEFKGRGRARRQARKTKRVANRQANKMTRINNKTTRKLTKQAGRQEQKRRRVAATIERKEMRGGPEQEEEVAMDPVTEETGYQETDTVTESGPRPQAPTSQGSEDSYDEESEEGYDDEEAGDDEGMEEYDEEAAFNGEESESAFTAELKDKAKINPKILDVARKIEWNKELILCLTAKMTQPGANTMELQAHIDNRKKRISELQTMLQAFSNARGGGKAQRQQVRAAKAVAKQERKAARVERKAARVEKKDARQETRAAKKMGPPPTEVQKDLYPEISNQRIEIPAEEAGGASEFAGGKNKTEIIALDNEGEFDSPETRLIEMKSGADGRKTIPWKPILVGSLIAITVIVIAKKAKLI